jgi:neutral ceramidase
LLSMAGYSEKVITPKQPIRFSCSGELISEDVHDELYAHALYLENDSSQCMVISLDLLGVDLELTDAIKKRIKEKTSIPEESILIAATHSHNTPYGLPAHVWTFDNILGPEIIEFRHFVIDKAVEAAVCANERKRQAKIGFGRGICEELGANRRRLGGPTDPEVNVAVIKGKDGEMIAVLVNYACHATVMHTTGLVPHIRQISADFPGELYKQLRSQLYDPNMGVMFFNGAAGDISTRYTRKEHSFNELTRLTGFLTDAVLTALENVTMNELKNIQVSSKKLEVARRTFPEKHIVQTKIDELENFIKTNESKTEYSELKKETEAIGGYKTLLNLIKYPGPEKYSTLVQRIEINSEMAIIAVPGELFSSFGKQLKTASELEFVWPVAYANDYIGYLVPKEEFELGGYEPAVARVGSTEVERLIEESINF